jgi:hypothetical protein
MFASITLDELVEERRQLDAAYGHWVERVGQYARSGDWAADGYVSAGAALADRCHMDRGVARSHVTLAAKLQRLESVRDALFAGEISRKHALLIAKAHTVARAEVIEELQESLTEFARHVPPRALGELIDRVTDAIDGDEGDANDDNKRDRRRLAASVSLDKMVFVDGLGDPISGEIVLTALKAEMQRDLQAHDPRTTEQRRWDALVNICRRTLDRGEVGTWHAVRPHVSAVVDLADYEGIKPLIVEKIRTEFANTGRVSRATIEQVVCDCDLTRVIMDGPSQVLDVGQATRTWPAPIAKAIVARDQHCRGPGCRRPWWDCQLHHVIPVAAGGKTSIENGALYCDPCHRDQHAKQRAGP